MSEIGESQKIPDPEKPIEFIINHGNDKIFGPEKENSFGKKIEDLINPPEGKEKVIKNDNLRRLATTATKPWNQTSENMDELLKKGNDWYLDSSKKIPEEEWEILAGLIYGEKSQLEAEQLKKTSSTVSSQGAAIDLDPLVNKISEGQESLLNALKNQQIPFKEFLNLSQKQAAILADSLKRVPTKEERERWIDVEYRQEFYTRFTPSLEPRFYTELTEKERRLFDTRWQLARAAYYKKAYLAFPEKLAENQDLILLGMEHMERLYNMPGVKQALEWYADVIVNKKEKVDRENKKTNKIGKINIFQCGNDVDFEAFREKMREEALGVIEKKDKDGNLIKIKLNSDQKKEADAVAWNWIFCSNLVESVDSRYSTSGERHGLPGALCSDDVRAVFHPQEKFENKSSKGQDWGAFGKWGSFQMKMIKNTFGNNRDDEFVFVAANRVQDFWSARRIDDKKIEVKVPECYPTTTLRSFWEGEKLDDEEFKKKINLDRKPNLLDFLLSKEEIKWEEIGSGFWVDYLPIKLSRAVKLLEYFKAKEIRMEVGKFGGVKNWADPLLEFFVRLGINEEKYGVSSGISKDEYKEEKRLAEKRFHNLKVWAVHAATGGEGNIESKIPEINLATFLSPQTRIVVGMALRDRNVKYLGKGEGLRIVDVI